MNSNNIEVARKLREIADSLANTGDATKLEKERQEALTNLQKFEKDLEMIRDYSYRLIPSRLVEAAKKALSDGLPDSSSPEVAFANLCIKLSEEYLKH
ncbi:MAG: hypothetical protein Q7S32_04745 [bacterium]|nr:hypothetical protein [bacterium]